MAEINENVQNLKTNLLKIGASILTENGRTRWDQYVNNINDAIGVQKAEYLFNLLNRIKKGEAKDAILKEVAESNGVFKTEIATLVNVFASDVIKDLNVPTNQEDYNVTTEVPENERFNVVEDRPETIVPPFTNSYIDGDDEVTMEVPENERIEKVQKYDMTKVLDQFKGVLDFYEEEFKKNPNAEEEITKEKTFVYEAITRVASNAPLKEDVSVGSDIVFYDNRRTTRREKIASTLMKAGFQDISDIVVQDPQKTKDLEILRNQLETISDQIKLISSVDSINIDDDVKIYNTPKL